MSYKLVKTDSVVSVPKRERLFRALEHKNFFNRKYPLTLLKNGEVLDSFKNDNEFQQYLKNQDYVIDYTNGVI